MSGKLKGQISSLQDNVKDLLRIVEGELRSFDILGLFDSVYLIDLYEVALVQGYLDIVASIEKEPDLSLFALTVEGDIEKLRKIRGKVRSFLADFQRKYKSRF